MKNAVRITSLLTLLLVSSLCFAAPPPLEKSEAEKILLSMGYKNVTIVSVVQGLSGEFNANGFQFAGNSAALVTAVYIKNNLNQDVVYETFYYSKELGWYYGQEKNDKIEGRWIGKMRIWNKDGYHEFKAKNSGTP